MRIFRIPFVKTRLNLKFLRTHPLRSSIFLRIPSTHPFGAGGGGKTSAALRPPSRLSGSKEVVSVARELRCCLLMLCWFSKRRTACIKRPKGTSIENRCLFAHSAASSGWTCQMEAPSMFLSSPELLHLIHVHQKEHAHGDPVRSCELCRTPPSFLHRRPQKAVPPVYTAFLRLTAFNPTSPAHSAQSKQSITGLCSEPMAHADQEA